jgi:organic radical activating enzyme
VVKKYFPIKTDTACRLKWAWSTIYLTDGTTGSCHRASFGKLNKDNFVNFHNTPEKITARETMLSGQWPDGGCEYCKNIELAGGHSDRNFQNTIPEVYPTELNNDPTLTHVDPVVLEIFFNNTCNLSCVYCTEKYSSSIQKENFKFGGPILLEDRDALQENKYNQLTTLMWEWLDGNFYKLQRLHILGGEPFILADFSKLIDFIDTHPNPNLELNVVTNLIVKPWNLKNQIDKLLKLQTDKKIKRIDILCSVDCWGPEQEYIRHGFKSALFEENFNYLLSCNVIRLGLLSTVSNLSIKSMPLLAKKFNEWYNIKEIFWYMHLVLPINSHVLSPATFAYSEWQNSLNQVDVLINNSTFDLKNTKQTLQGLMSALRECNGNLKMQSDLIDYLDKLDLRRNQSWRTTFPWLEQKVKDVV